MMLSLAHRARWLALATAGSTLCAVIGAPAVADASVQSCGQSAGATICLTAPSATLSGTVVVSVTRSGGPAGGTLEFYLDGSYLNFEYQRPYEFSWPTAKELDGVHTVSARLHAGATVGAYISMSVTLHNGNTASVPRSPSDWQQLYQAQPGNILAAVGNIGAQKPAELQLEQYIESTMPAVFGYLGEVHEYGTWATTLDHYGLASLDDPLGVGTEWGRMAAYTLPTPGNHQRDYITEFRDYWHQRPLWSTTTLDGVRIYDLTSECKANGGCLTNGDQARWLQQQLSANAEPCVVAMWHRPVVSKDSERSGDTMATTWQLLAANGGDLVLNADTRDMEEIKPMNAALQTGRSDSHMVELISGAGAARWVSTKTIEKRVAWRLYQTPGAVWVWRTGTPNQPQLTWQFRSSTGTVLRTGSVACDS
jgi:Big-like domain-containing protein